MRSRGKIRPHGFPFWVKWNRIILERLREELRLEHDFAVAADEGRLLALTRAMAEYRAAEGQSRAKFESDCKPPQHSPSGGGPGFEFDPSTIKNA